MCVHLCCGVYVCVHLSSYIQNDKPLLKGSQVKTLQYENQIKKGKYNLGCGVLILIGFLLLTIQSLCLILPMNRVVESK